MDDTYIIISDFSDEEAKAEQFTVRFKLAETALMIVYQMLIMHKQYQLQLRIPTRSKNVILYHLEV